MRLADAYAAFLLDLDGVVYRGDAAVPGAAEGLSALREAGRRIVFLTNNSARTPEQVAGKLRSVGVEASPDEVVTSAQVAAALVARDAGPGAEAFVVGEEGVRRALSEAGVRVVDGSPERADVVVVGWDRAADYDRLRTASVLVQRGARLVATNADASYPAPGGELWPGAGALLAAVETTTEVRAVVAGKPHRPMFDVAVERAGTETALVVGDRIETDVAGAAAAGLDAALVLTGAATLADLPDHDAVPQAILLDLRGLLAHRPQGRLRTATRGDRDAVRALLAEAGLDPAEAARPGEVLVVADGALIATAAVEMHGEEAYLRSVAVRRDVRGHHLGAQVVAAAARGAAFGGAVRCSLLTEAAEGFFARLGFERVDRGSLPAAIAEASRGCDASAVAMRRALRPPQTSQGVAWRLR